MHPGCDPMHSAKPRAKAARLRPRHLFDNCATSLSQFRQRLQPVAWPPPPVPHLLMPAALLLLLVHHGVPQLEADL
eukprot:scaffold37118_cov57-Phaeocystis_antarctica.AAC.2